MKAKPEVPPVSFARFDQAVVPEYGFMRLPQVLSVFPIGRSTWWSGVKSGKYPKPIKLGSQIAVWKASDIMELIRAASKSADERQAA